MLNSNCDCLLSHSVVSDSLWPHGLYPARFLCPWDSPGKNTGGGELLCPPPGDLPNSGIGPRSPALQADSSPSEPPGEPKNTGVGNLTLLQGICPTQESNGSLLHCRRILYQRSSQGSPALILPFCHFSSTSLWLPLWCLRQSKVHCPRFSTITFRGNGPWIRQLLSPPLPAKATGAHSALCSGSHLFQPSYVFSSMFSS